MPKIHATLLDWIGLLSVRSSVQNPTHIEACPQNYS
jgi:hypothetical protein